VLRWLLAGVCMATAFAAAAAGAAMAAGPAAQSADGRWLVAADGQGIAVYDRGVRVKTLAATSRDGRTGPSAVASIHPVAARRSFVIAFETLNELWELSIDPQAAPIFDGLVHDYRLGEGIAESGYLGARRTRLDVPLRELAFDDSGAFVLGRSAPEPGSNTVLHLVNLDIRRTIGRFAVGGDPDLAAARTLKRDGRTLLSVPDRHGAPPTMLDLRRAQRVEPFEPAKAARPPP
jgi:hypothetical protein